MSESLVTIDSAPVERAPPLVIAVMPTVLGLPSWAYVLACSPPVLILLVLLVVAAFNPGPRSDKIWRGLPTACSMLFLLTGAFVVAVSVVTRIGANPSYSLEHDADIVPPDSKVAMHLSSLWTSVFGLPKAESLVNELLQNGIDIRAHPVFLALGAKKVPGQVDEPFEPVIMSPGENFEKTLPTLILAVLGLILMYIGVNFLPIVRQFNTLRGHVLFALLIGLRWLWVSWIDVKYLRIAPGMIEVLHYRWFAKTPRVRAYPIAPGTLIALQHPTAGTRLLLARGEQEDHISMVGILDVNPIVERIWQAVRSTLPTPPLSNQELVG